MLKQYFTDGLIQIAIVLSLLRTDLNSYLSHNYVNYPEIQDVILGQSAAYTQTNFHNAFNNHFSHLGSPEIYRKDVDAVDIFQTSFYRELRSFRRSSNFRELNNYETFLLVAGQSGPTSFHTQESTETTNNNNVDGNNNNPEISDNLSSEDLEQEGQNLLQTLEERIEAISPLIHTVTLQGSDPTREDLDLIEVLWRQDIDLGVGKEVFDPNLRQELEREREIELQKERQKQKEQELLQKKLEEQRHHAEQRWLNDNFTQDGETGEWIPLGGNRVPPPSLVPDLNQVPDNEQFLPHYENLYQQQQQQPSSSYNVSRTNHMPPPQYPGTSIHSQSSQMYNGNMGQYSQPGVSSGVYQTQQPSVHIYTQSQQQQQQQHFNSNNQSFHHAPQPFPNMQQQQQQQHLHHHQQQHQQQQSLPRQASLEATWQDLVNILDLPANTSASSARAMALNNTPSMDNSTLGQMDNTSSMLIQNASMPTPPPMNGNMTFNNTGLNNLSSHRSPPHTSGLLSPTENFNSSLPSGSEMSGLDWDPCSNFLFPNITSGLNQSEPIEDVDELLPDLITEDELDVDEINFAEMGIEDGIITPSPSQGGQDDSSSDSAVSMGSRSPEQNDFSDGAMSPFDGLEGATGGHDSPHFSKTSKYDPDDYKYSRSCSFSSGDSNSSNFSASSNDSGGGGHYGQSNGGGHFGSSSNGHINHNHTYPVKPGADPKDIKKHFNNNREGRQKGPQSKDAKRIEELKIPFTLSQIVHSPVEEFNDMLTRHKLSDQQLQLIRDIRRRGKNKVAAQNCRKRKIGVLETLEEEMTRMEKMRDKLISERHMMNKQSQELKNKLGNLYSDIFHSLRDENGQPYDPSRYSLQQSSDGDVFLVPRNYTMEDELNKKRKSEQK